MLAPYRAGLPLVSRAGRVQARQRHDAARAPRVLDLGACRRARRVVAALPRRGLEATLLPTTLIAERIRAGGRADLAIASSAAIDELAREGFLEPGRTDLVKSLVGIAVRTGAPRPDISTVDALVATLIAARSVAMSRVGASGIAFAALLQRLGIAGQVKTVVIPSGFTAELAARGEAELAVQQISELMAVPGVEVVGAFPPGAECAAVFSAGVSAYGAMQAEARAFIAMLASDAAASVFRANGLEPVAKLD